MHPFMRISTLVLAIIIIPLTGLLYYSLGNFLNPVNVGVIGGADGPTAIFLAPNSIGILFVLTVIVFGIGALLIRSKIKRDQEQGASGSDGDSDREC
jgi:Na+-transporting methylmalonyl-CoA/oxaloacetate decarboxylase beta subunit